jgi:hypothetical protein
VLWVGQCQRHRQRRRVKGVFKVEVTLMGLGFDLEWEAVDQ